MKKQKTIYKGKASKVEINKYYDLDGMIISEGQEVLELKKDSDIEIVEVKSSFGFTFWEVFANGKNISEEYEVTGYKQIKDRLVLRACTGAG